MINVYAADATTFTDNGLAIVQPVSSVIRQTLNGEYALEAVFTADDAQYVQPETILVAEDVHGRQPFRAKEIEARLDGTVTVYAIHKFYDLADHYIKDVYPTVDTGNEAITAILAATEDAHPFTGSSDIATVSSARYVMRSPVSCLLDTSEPNCFLNRWGGEILRDWHTVAINTRIGADNGVIIAYRKNLTGLTAHSDTSAVKTRVYPTGLTEKDAVLEGDPVDSAYIANYPHPKSTRAHFSDVKVGAEVDGAVPYPTQAAALAELQSRAEALFDAGIDLPSVSLDVQFIDLSKTVEYAQYAALESVSLGDTVTVKHEPLGMDLSLRVSAYEWDTELKRYISLTVGDIQPNIGQSVIDADIDISAINDSLTSMLKQNEKYNAVYINHDEGFVAEATVGGKAVKVTTNATDGISITVDTVKVFGVDSTGSVFAQKLSNIEDGSYYMTYGYGGSPGIECFMPTIGKWLGISPDVNGGIQFYDLNDDLRVAMPNDGSYFIYDSADFIRLWLNKTLNFCTLRVPNGASYNEVGVDATGAYKITAGTKTYL